MTNKRITLIAGVLAFLTFGALAGVTFLGIVVLTKYVKNVPPCDQSCMVRFIQLRDDQHAHYQTSRHLSAVLRRTKVDVAFYKKGWLAYRSKLKRCMLANRRFAGVDAVVASARRLLIIEGVKEPSLSLLLETLRIIGREAKIREEMLRR